MFTKLKFLSGMNLKLFYYMLKPGTTPNQDSRQHTKHHSSEMNSDVKTSPSKKQTVAKGVKPHQKRT